MPKVYILFDEDLIQEYRDNGIVDLSEASLDALDYDCREFKTPAEVKAYMTALQDISWAINDTIDYEVVDETAIA